jgi:thiaminase
MKDELELFYTGWKKIFEGEFTDLQTEKACKILDSVLQYCKSEDYSDALPEFKKFTKYLDISRNQSILDVAPRYKRLFDND